jgi:hypothetical protein
MAKYRLCNGLAIAPEKDMRMLREMSRTGWHLAGLSGLLYRFEEGQPQDYDYALNMERRIGPDMLSFYEASGWTPVVAQHGYQIFRAAAGTSPIFSDTDSEMEILRSNRRQSGKWALIFMGLLLGCLFVLNQVDQSFYVGLATGAGLVLMVCVIFTVFPFIGYTRTLRKKQRNRLS